MNSFIVAACQLPDVQEDVGQALWWIDGYAHRAANKGARLVCFPECFLQGYLTEKESAQRHAINLNSSAFEAVLKKIAHIKPTLVFGMIETDARHLFNTAVVVKEGRLAGYYRKIHLMPGESVFQKGSSCPVFDADGLTFGINICSDTQNPKAAAAVAKQGAKLIVCPANNMMKREQAEQLKYHHNKVRAQRAKETGVWLVSSDVTGENDSHTALGPTAVINPQGQIVAQVPLREVGIAIADIT